MKMKRLGLIIGMVVLVGVATAGGLAAAGSGNITQDLAAYWDLNETSGTRYDSHSNNHLADYNSVGYTTTGVVGNAARFHLPDYEYLSSVTHNDDLSMAGDTDFTVAAWIMVEDSYAPYNFIYFIEQATEYRILYSTPSLRFCVYSPWECVCDTSLTQNPDQWYFVAGWHNAASNTIHIQINGGGVYTVAHSGGIYSGAGAFKPLYGASPYTGTARLDEVGVWRRILTAAERDWLYNDGNGRAYDPAAALWTSHDLPMTPTPVASMTYTQPVTRSHTFTTSPGITYTFNANMWEYDTYQQFRGMSTVWIDMLSEYDIIALPFGFFLGIVVFKAGMRMLTNRAKTA